LQVSKSWLVAVDLEITTLGEGAVATGMCVEDMAVRFPNLKILDLEYSLDTSREYNPIIRIMPGLPGSQGLPEDAAGASSASSLQVDTREDLRLVRERRVCLGMLLGLPNLQELHNLADMKIIADMRKLHASGEVEQVFYTPS
jgi:hypothetical protein